MTAKSKIRTFFGNRQDWAHILEAFLGSRLILTLAAWFSTYFSPNGDYQRYIDRGYFLSPKWLIDIWCRWDSKWQLSITKWGYYLPQNLEEGYSNMAFFPLYPYLVKILTCWLPARFRTESVYLMVGLILSNLCFVFALYGLYQLGRLLFSEETVSRTITLVFCLPCAFYFSAYYSESLFFFLIVYALLAAEKEHWFISALLTALAALTRPHGVLLLLPIIWIYMSKRSWDFKKIGTAWLWYLLVPAGVCAYFYGLYRLTGDFFFFFKAQSSWGRSLSDTSAFAEYFAPLRSRHNRPTTIDLCMIVFSLIMSIVLLVKQLNKAYGIYALACTLVLIGTGNLYSMMRYTAVIFPVWLMTADLLKNKRTFTFICALLGAVQVLLFCAWINYYWVA